MKVLSEVNLARFLDEAGRMVVYLISAFRNLNFEVFFCGSVFDRTLKHRLVRWTDD